MFFKSAVDPWVYALALGLPVALVLGAVPILATAQSTMVMLGTLTLVLGAITPPWLLFFTYYRIDSTLLRIQAGPFVWLIPLDQIRSITPSRSLVSSPALSMNRLKIDYGRQRCIWVSPKDKSSFIKALGYQPSEILNIQPCT